MTTKDKTYSAEAFGAAVDAAFPGLPGGMTMGEAERRIAAALDAYLAVVRGAA